MVTKKISFAIIMVSSICASIMAKECSVVWRNDGNLPEDIYIYVGPTDQQTFTSYKKTIASHSEEVLFSNCNEKNALISIIDQSTKNLVSKKINLPLEQGHGLIAVGNAGGTLGISEFEHTESVTSAGGAGGTTTTTHIRLLE